MERQWMKDLLEKAKEKGFSDFEIYYEAAKRFSISVFKGELDKFSASEPSGVSVRGIFNGKMGNAYTEKIDTDALECLIEDCLTNAMINETEETVLLYEPTGESVGFERRPSNLSELTAEEKIKRLLEAEKACYAQEPQLDQVQNQYGDFATHIEIVNTKGLDVSYDSHMGYVYFSPIIKREGDTKNEHSMGLFINKEDVQELTHVSEAIKLTNAMFGAQILPSGSYKTVFSNKSMSNLIEVMAGIFSAEAADKGLSAFKDKVGQVVANPILSLIDDPHLPEGFASVPFDSEGVPTQRQALINSGKLTGFLHNLKTAEKFKVPPTGNGFKASFKSPVGISGTNMYLQPGKLSLEDLLKDVETGLYVTGLDGLHAGINAITGDFSLSCRGHKIEGGVLGTAFHQMTVSGNYFEMLKNIEAIASDLVFDGMDSSAVYGSPSVFAGHLVFAGE